MLDHVFHRNIIAYWQQIWYVRFATYFDLFTLRIIFAQSLKKGKFLKIWKKANVAPVHKKEDKNLLKNYLPISLLPIFSKIFERVIDSSLFNHFQSNKLFTSSQSGFLAGDLCITQLL